MADAVYFVTYTGNDVVTLGKCGLFQKGTSAYVGEADANGAKARGDFSVSGPLGGTPAVQKVSAKDATKSEDEARAKAQPAAPPAPAPAPAKAEEKKAEPKKEEAKKDEAKKDEPKKEEAKKEEPKPAAAAAS